MPDAIATIYIRPELSSDGQGVVWCTVQWRIGNEWMTLARVTFNELKPEIQALWATAAGGLLRSESVYVEWPEENRV